VDFTLGWLDEYPETASIQHMKQLQRFRADSASRLGMLAAATAFIVVLAFPHAASAAFPGPNGKIAFEANGHIYTVRANGQGRQRIAGNGLTPAFSADGRWIVFARYLGDNREIYKMRADGSHKARLTRSSAADEFDPSFSPSGRRIVFARELGSSRADIWTMRAGGGDKRRLTQTQSTVEFSPKYSPNGRRIVLVRNPGVDLVTMRADGSNAHRITTTPFAYEWEPDFSPDGSRIVYAQSTERRPTDHIFFMRADGTHPRRLTRGAKDNTSPAYSPSGKWIAFARNRRIYKMRAHGSRLRRVTRGGEGTSPSWGRAR
jgi:Tol biopolymer transport system component